MKEQMEREQPKYKTSPMSDIIEERCSGLEHVTHEFDCLQYFPTDDCNDKKQKKEYEKKKRKYEMHPNLTKLFQTISMPYTPLNESEKSSETQSCA